jgi:hypothetical protein
MNTRLIIISVGLCLFLFGCGKDAATKPPWEIPDSMAVKPEPPVEPPVDPELPDLIPFDTINVRSYDLSELTANHKTLLTLTDQTANVSIGCFRAAGGRVSKEFDAFFIDSMYPELGTRLLIPSQSIPSNFMQEEDMDYFYLAGLSVVISGEVTDSLILSCSEENVLLKKTFRFIRNFSIRLDSAINYNMCEDMANSKTLLTLNDATGVIVKSNCIAGIDGKQRRDVAYIYLDSIYPELDSQLLLPCETLPEEYRQAGLPVKISCHVTDRIFHGCIRPNEWVLQMPVYGIRNFSIQANN